MFDTTLRLLLSGAFVCETTAPAEYRYLQDETHRRLADDYLRKIGRRLASTGTGHAYFMAYAEVGSGERTEIRRLFGEIKHELRPVVNFLRFIMQSLRREETPTPGSVSTSRLSSRRSPRVPSSLMNCGASPRWARITRPPTPLYGACWTRFFSR